MAALSLATQTPAGASPTAQAETAAQDIDHRADGSRVSSCRRAHQRSVRPRGRRLSPSRRRRSSSRKRRSPHGWHHGQSAYLGMLGDRGALRLSGFYDPFSYQFAYGDAGTASPLPPGSYSYNDYVLMTNSPTSIGGNFQDQQWNAWMRYAWLLRNSTVLAWTGWMNGKFWTGPSGPQSAAGEPFSYFRFSVGLGLCEQLELATRFCSAAQRHVQRPNQFRRELMADVRRCTYRFSPQWLVAAGAAFIGTGPAIG